MSTNHITPNSLRIGAKYNWRNQVDWLAYMGTKHYPGDRRTWFQFEKVNDPGVVWCEVLAEDLGGFEETKAEGCAA